MYKKTLIYSLLLAVLVGLAGIMLTERPGQAGGKRNLAKTSNGESETALASMLNADGTLNLSRGFNGSLNPQGFRMEYAENGAPRFVPTAPTAIANWDTQFVNANGAHTFGYAVAVIGTDVYVGGSPLETAGNVLAKGVAKWNGSTWSALGSGVDGSVYAMAVSGTDLYVAGNFSTAGGISANNVAKWNGSAWSALGSGVSGGLVLSLAASGSDVYAGGTFSMAGGNAASNIARWNGSAWSALGSGTDQQVVAIAVSGSNVYAGGEFSMAGGNPANYVARWNGSAWSALGSGVDFTVNALAVSGSDLYVGGSFSTAGGNPANSIARWNGSSWSALGSGITSSTSAVVRSIVVVGSNVYAGGEFDTAGGNPATNAARWNGSAWSALGNGLASGRTSNNTAILSLAASGSNVYAAGGFTKSGNTEINGIARWNGTSWSPLGSTSNSVNYNVYAVAVSGNDVYVGGEFDFAGGLPANNIAKWNGSAWSALGSGVNRVVRALVVNGTDVYAGGEFTTAGSTPASFVARWNGSAWSALGGGITNGVGVKALAFAGGNLYAGGFFFTAGGNSANCIARWNGSAWSALGSGASGEVNALAISGSDLYAGGSFTTPGSKVAKWNGSAWSQLGTGITSNPSTVYALAVIGTDVYAGGFFGQAGGNPIIGLAKWNGSAWSQLGSGLNGYVFALLPSGSDLYVAGNFDTAGGTPVSGLAKWNGSAWSGLGVSTGTNGFPNSLALQGPNLFVGGTFTALSGTLSHYFGRFNSCITDMTVNNTGDGADASAGDGVCETATGNGVCTLRAAIQEANASTSCSPLTINFSVTGIIDTSSILSPIHPNLTINGPGANQLTVRGAGTHPIFRTSGTANVGLQISGLTLTNGFASTGTNAGAIEFNSTGGMLTITGCALLNNHDGNGQVFSNQSGGVTISNTCISGNNAALGVTVDRTPLSMTNTTISDNANGGLQVFTGGTFTVSLLNCTIANNNSPNNNAFGIVIQSSSTNNTVTTLKNTIVANNSAALQILVFGSGTTVTSLGNNLIGDNSLSPAAGDLVNTNPLLSSLGNYGGPTQTIALLPGSPAINAGSNTGTPTSDQRGIARVGNVDIGAFESRGFTLAMNGGNNQSAVTSTAFANPLSVGVTSAFSEPVNGGKVTFTPPGSGASATIAGNPATITGGVAATGTVTANSIVGGPYTVAAAANGATPTVNFSLTNLNSPPTITAQAGLTRQQGAGSSNSQIATVNDAESGANGVTVKVNGSASATVNGVTVSNISNSGGTVTADIVAICGASNASFTLTATDGHAATATATLNVTVTGITLSALVNGLTFVPYSQTLTASGGTGSYTFSLVSGTLPPGLTMNGNMITGTPTAAGASTFTIRADDDSNTCFGERVYTINIGSTGLMYYPLARPVRLLDTRPGASPNACNQPNVPIPGGTSRTQPARGTCEGLTIPANATTITGHITTVQSGGGSLTLYPSDAPQPNVTNSNYLVNEILNNAFTVGLGVNDGAFNIFVGTNTDVVIDVTGYYAPPGAGGLYFHPLPKPIRLLDTRSGFTGCQTPGAPLQTMTTRTQTGVLTCDGVTIPTGAMALVGNATTTNSTGSGYLTLWPADAAQPFASSSNFAAGINRNAPFTVGLSLNGEFNIYTARTTDLVIDVMGYYSTQASDANGQGLLFNSLGAPLRLMDTRAGQPACYQPGAPMTGQTVYTQETQIPCTNLTSAARALVGNVSALNAVSNGYLTFWPSNAVQPTVATSNYQPNRVFNRHFTVGLGTDNAFKRYAASTTDVIIDISGFFAP